MSSLGYEIDFLPVGDGEKSGDAIALRYGTEEDGYTIHVVDGGTLASGEELVKHINKYYGEPGYVDHVVCTHPDGDHASGLRIVLDEFQVGTLWMNRPWLYVNELLPRVEDKRITAASLEKQLREAYPYIDELEKLATAKGIDIEEAFQGDQIGAFTVFSPTYDFYLALLCESTKTPESKEADLIDNAFTAIDQGIKAAWDWIMESWSEESLREDGVTSAENETSIVQMADFAGRRVLLNGDAGLRALNAAADYWEKDHWGAPKLRFMQVPHHGSRRNIAPSVLNRWLGDILEEGETRDVTAFVSASGKSDKHPRQAVVNAFTRRGARVHGTKGEAKRHSHNMPDRAGWSASTPIPFRQEVEPYTDEVTGAVLPADKYTTKSSLA